MMLAALLLAAAPDWASVVQGFPELKTFAPVQSVEGPLFARIGGTCYRAGALKLGEGSRNGHVWHWTFDVSREHGAVTLTGPSVVHGYDKAGDTRTFKDKGPVRKLFLGPAKDDAVPLYEASFTLEVGCWGSDESTQTCEGKRVTCKRCSILRLIGGPRFAQHPYGDGVVHADLTKDCAHLCDGPGLLWADFEALQKTVAKTPVVDLEAPPAAQLYRTEAACKVGTVDLAPDFKPVEP